MRLVRLNLLTALLAFVLVIVAAISSGAAQVDSSGAGKASFSETADIAACVRAGSVQAGCFVWQASGEVLNVNDTYADGWSILVELWINGKLSRTCWDTNGANNGSSTCNFSIAEDTKIYFYIAQASYSSCDAHSPSRGCNKGAWAGPFIDSA